MVGHELHVYHSGARPPERKASLMALAVNQEQLFQLPGSAKSQRNSTVFTDNMSLPVHRWFRYSAGFSAAWVEHVVGEAERVLDPFAGSGTSMLAARAAGAESIGVERHPFVARVARAKLAAWAPADAFEARAAAVL